MQFTERLRRFRSRSGNDRVKTLPMQGEQVQLAAASHQQTPSRVPSSIRPRSVRCTGGKNGAEPRGLQETRLETSPNQCQTKIPSDTLRLCVGETPESA